jgi:hypothetical protein
MLRRNAHSQHPRNGLSSLPWGGESWKQVTAVSSNRRSPEEPPDLLALQERWVHPFGRWPKGETLIPPWGRSGSDQANTSVFNRKPPINAHFLTLWADFRPPKWGHSFLDKPFFAPLSSLTPRRSTRRRSGRQRRLPSPGAGCASHPLTTTSGSAAVPAMRTILFICD